MDTNGIAFDSKYHNLFAENLYRVNISLNASNVDVYQKGVWRDGEVAYSKIRENLKTYCRILKEKNLEVFNPSVSMVINEDTLFDIRNFVKLVLEMRSSLITCHFDFNLGMFTEKFRCALKELMKIEKLLSGKVKIIYKSGSPVEERELVIPEVNSYNIDSLKLEYRELWELAKDRSISSEQSARKDILLRKKSINVKENEDFYDAYGAIRDHACTSVFSQIMVTLNRLGEIGFGYCCKAWKNFVLVDEKRHKINKLINSLQFKLARREILQGNFSFCEPHCPCIAFHRRKEKKSL